MAERWVEQWDKNISSLFSLVETTRDTQDPVKFNKCLSTVLQRGTTNRPLFLKNTPFANYDSFDLQTKGTLDSWIKDYVDLKETLYKDVEPRNFDISRKKVLETIAQQSALVDPNYSYPRMVWSALATELLSDLSATPQTEAEKENDLGDALIQEMQYPQSLPHLDRSMTLSPTFCLPIVNKGIAYKNMGQLLQAAECYTQALTINPRYKKAWNNLGVAHELVGSPSDALYCFQQTLDIDPINEFAARRIVALY